MNVRFFNPGLGYLQHKAEFDEAIERVLTKGDLILRKDVEKFEEWLADFCGVKYAVGLNSGTDALYLALKTAGVRKGDEVITSSHTFVATVQVIHQLGATPVLVDIGDDGLWDKKEVEKKVTKKTKAIIPVHLTGLYCAPPILYGDIKIIEDACQAIGATATIPKPQRYPEGIVRAGEYGHIGCFSFYPAKILGAYGDAGAVTTDDKEIADEIRELRNHYKKDYSKWGINSRLDNLQAAILMVKVKYLEEALMKRAAIARRYWEELADIPDITLPIMQEGRVWQDFIIRLKYRDDFFEYMANQGVETMKNEYPFPIAKLPKSLAYESETIRIPCNELLTDDEVGYVIKCIRAFYGK